jgi:uncharacterized protein (DUF1786 family)
MDPEMDSEIGATIGLEVDTKADPEIVVGIGP